MFTHYLINGILVIVLAISLVTDIKGQKIYNIVTMPAIVLGIILNGTFYGMEGLLDSFKGIGIVTAVLVAPFIAGGMGAGDMKLLMAAGALKGLNFAFEAMLATFLTGGIIAVIIITKRGIWREVLGRLTANLYFFVALPVFKRQVSTENNFKNQEQYAFPYGIAIFIGTISVLLFR